MLSAGHHQRALEVLRSLDEAKHQRSLNDANRNLLLDAEDVLLQLHQQLFTKKMHEDIKTALNKAQDSLKRFESELAFTALTKKKHQSRYMQDCGLEAPQSLLVNESQSEVRGIMYTQERVTKFAAMDKKKVFEKHFDFISQTLDNAVRLADTARIESVEWVPVIAPLMDIIERLLHGQPSSEVLKELAREIEILSEKERGIAAEQEQAAADGEIAASEAKAEMRITLLEALADLITQKFCTLDGEEDAQVAQPQAEMHSAFSSAKSKIQDTRARITERKRLLERDIARLAVESSKAKADEDLARSALDETLKQSNDRLRKQQDEAGACWEEIHRLEERLMHIAEARREEIDSRVKTMEREERRRVEMQNFTEFVQSHTQLLQTSVRTCQAEETLAEMMENIVSASCDAIGERLQSVQKDIVGLRNDALNEHLEHFRRQYLVLGDLQYKKERFLDEVEKRIEHSTMQQHLAMESLNPVARHHSNQRHEIELLKERILAQLEVLRSKAGLYIEAFKPTEQALAAGGKTFTHPLHELQELNKGKGRKLAEYYALVVQNPTLPSIGSIAPRTVEAEALQLEEDRRNLVRYRRSKPRTITNTREVD